VSDGNWTAELQADRQVYGKGQAAAQAGSYTFVIPGSSAANSPAGAGFGTVKVDGAGNVQWTGVLADGTKVSQKSALSKQGIWPLYASVYGGAGVVMSWVEFGNQSQSDMSGQLVWLKPAGAVGLGYAGGFTNEVNASGSRYHAPAAGKRVMGLNHGNGSVVLSGGGLGSELSTSISLASNNKVSAPASARLSLSITPSTGLFKGTAVNPSTGKPMTFQGALFEKGQIGIGYFLNGDKSGAVYIDTQN
jgi:hypothetical protein